MTQLGKKTNMIREEWLKRYENRTGCEELDLLPDEQIFFHPEYGFLTYFIYDDVIEIHHCCGNGKQWQKVVKQMMKDYGLTKVRFFTQRNPDAWIRKYGGHIRGYQMEVDIDEIKE